jgi:hypothetical protein
MQRAWFATIAAIAITIWLPTGNADAGNLSEKLGNTTAASEATLPATKPNEPQASGVMCQLRAVSEPSPAAKPDTPHAGGVTCQVRAWGEPYPSVIILARLAPECSEACVQVIRTNGWAYPLQCASLRRGQLDIDTKTGNYRLAVGPQSLRGDFLSTVDSAYSRTDLKWDCDGSPARVTDPMPSKVTAADR